MRTITRCFTYFISFLIIVISSGCVETIVSVGEVALDTYISSTAEEAKARRQAKYIAEEIQATRAATKEPKEYTKQDFKKPDRIVRIDQESEVYMYYEPAKGKIKLFAFTGDKATNTSSGNIAANKSKSDEQLRKEFINLFSCYEHLRVDAVTGEPPVQESPDSSSEQ